MSADERFGVVQCVMQGRDSPGVAAVAQGDGHITQQPAAFGTPQGGLAVTPAKALVVQGHQLRQGWEQGFDMLGLGELGVPGADLLTDVTAEYPVAELGPQRRRNSAPVLNRQIRYAHRRPQHIAVFQRPGWAGVHAAGTASGVVLGQARALKLQVNQHLGQKKPRAGPFAQQHGVFAKPAQATVAGPFALQQRAGINIRTGPQSGPQLAQKGGQLAQLGGDTVVIVQAERVGRNPAPQFLFPVHLGHGRRGVGTGQTDHTPGLRKRNGRVEASFGPAGQVVHIPGVALRQPSPQKIFAGQPAEPGKATRRKSQGGSFGADPVFQAHASV